jgi:hypothetical protein
LSGTFHLKKLSFVNEPWAKTCHPATGVDLQRNFVHHHSMSIAEIKAEARRLPADDVQHLAAYFYHLSRRHEPGYAGSLDAAAQAAESGDKVTLSEVKRLDAELGQAGL